MAIHSWWAEFGEPVADASGLPTAFRELVTTIQAGVQGVSFVEMRHCVETGRVAVHIEIEVERPQVLAFPIRAVEPIAIVMLPGLPIPPTILALRTGFPDTPHQNGTPVGAPVALCVDDRPWAEAHLSFTSIDLVRRAQQWLSKAACGELHDTARPLDPLFFRAPRTLIIPRSALQSPANRPSEFVGCVHGDDQMVIIARALSELGGRVPDVGRLAVLVLRAGPQPMMRLRQPPTTLAELAHELAGCGVELIAVLKSITAEWAGLHQDDLRRLSSGVAILVAFPISDGKGNTVDDLRAFVTADTAGEIGVALGSLHRNTSGVGATTGYVKALLPSASVGAETLRVEPTEVHLTFDQELGAAMAGQTVDPRSAVIVGAGSLGSQVALNLAREGAFSWTVVDNDRLMPHNLARHGLPSMAVGLPKAVALAAEIQALQGSPAVAISADVMAPIADQRDKLDLALNNADLIIDASASVAAARYLSDLASSARRISAFFNPSGTSLVLLTEAADRSVTLRDLEAQYHGLIQTVPAMAVHLAVQQSGLRYSGSCRALTNRISASNAALLSAIASRGIRETVACVESSICIWTVTLGGEVRLEKRLGVPVTRVTLGGWELAYDAALLDQLGTFRNERLPCETGGVLLGIADMSRRSLHLVTALAQPVDSVGSVEGFERGVFGLLDTVKEKIEASLHHIRYVGEWHSHPRRASALPSSLDLKQIAWLRRELEIEGLPALMAIAADNGRFSFMLAGMHDGGQS